MSRYDSMDKGFLFVTISMFVVAVLLAAYNFKEQEPIPIAKITYIPTRDAFIIATDTTIIQNGDTVIFKSKKNK